LLLVTTSSFIFFTPKNLNKTVIPILSIAFIYNCHTWLLNLKPLQKNVNVSFPGKNCARYKKLHDSKFEQQATLQ
jgi:hypothetical protein